MRNSRASRNARPRAQQELGQARGKLQQPELRRQRAGRNRRRGARAHRRLQARDRTARGAGTQGGDAEERRGMPLREPGRISDLRSRSSATLDSHDFEASRMESSVPTLITQADPVELIGARSRSSIASSSARSSSCALCIACLLARGHLLIEDIPGVGKTTLAHALAESLGLSYQRIQFTSDLLPADIIGVSVFERETSDVPVSQGTDLLAARARGRGQSRDAEGAERAARGDGRAPGHGGRPDVSARRAVLRRSRRRTRCIRSARIRCRSRSSIAS